jgi:putative ABC transport system permease protein
MDNVFGLSMNWILAVLAGIMFLCLLSVAFIAIFNPIVFKMAIRNPPRRKAQSILIVFGLMLATLIVSSALTTGDTLNHTITKITYDTLGPVDQTIAFVGEAGGNGSLSTSSEPIDAALADQLQEQFAGDPDIKAFMPMLTIDVPAISFERQLSEPSVVLAGID